MSEQNQSEQSNTSAPAVASGELLPCPFCGSREIVIENDDGRRSVGCRNEGCFGYQSLTTYARHADAIKAWNTRRSGSANDSEVIEWIAKNVTAFEFHFWHPLHRREVRNCAQTGIVFRDVVAAAMRATSAGNAELSHGATKGKQP